MVFKRFRLVVLSRVLLLCATIYLLLHLLFNMQTRLYATMLIVTLIIIYQIYALIHYVEKTNRDLNRFLMTIKHEDFSQTFLGAGLGSSFEELKRAFNEVIQKFHRARTEKEEHFRYLQTVVQHVGIGLITFNADGKVDLLNTAAKRLLKKPTLKNISDLKPISEDLVDTLLNIGAGQKALVRISSANEMLQLVVNATEFVLRDQNFTLVSLQNIQSELEEQELEAWRKLIRVLTHEIMNSITPIASLASTLNDLIRTEGGDTPVRALEAETRTDIEGGLRTIQSRSEGLLHFVNAYRDLTRVPIPDLRIFPVRGLLEQVTHLLNREAKDCQVQVRTDIRPLNLELTADRKLIEQVLINILKNAVQALGDQAEKNIHLSSQINDRGRPIIQVTDNGPGIPEKLLDKIFIPFFTTKREGSGIGLSLSREIMRLHGGAIMVRSKPGETIVTLRF